MPPKGFGSITVPLFLKNQLAIIARLRGYTSIRELLEAKLEVLRYA